jgi:hypothetical protein
MVSEGGVAVFAGVVGGTAFHFDGDDIGEAVIVEATSLRIEVEAADFGRRWEHVGRRIENNREADGPGKGRHAVA